MPIIKLIHVETATTLFTTIRYNLIVSLSNTSSLPFFYATSCYQCTLCKELLFCRITAHVPFKSHPLPAVRNGRNNQGIANERIIILG